MRWNRLFAAVWRLHKRAVVIGAVAAAGLLVGLTVWGTGLTSPCGCGAERASAEAPSRALLNRVWFDRYPESARDEISVWIWLAGGIGVYQHGSAWRSSHDIFEFERNGNALATRFLHDGAEARTTYRVEVCDAAPFDLCLTLESSARGPSRYYSWGDPDDMAAYVPWGPSLLEAARARAR